MELRPLKAKDRKHVMRIFKAVNGAEIIKAVFNRNEDEKGTKGRGKSMVIQIVDLLKDALGDGLDEVDALLAELANCTVEEIGDLGLLEYSQLIESLVEQKEMKAFFDYWQQRFTTVKTD